MSGLPERLSLSDVLPIVCVFCRGAGGPKFTIIQEYAIAGATQAHLMEMLQDSTERPPIFLPNFYNPFIVNSPIGITSLGVPKASYTDCYLHMHSDPAAPYPNSEIKCRSAAGPSSHPSSGNGGWWIEGTLQIAHRQVRTEGKTPPPMTPAQPHTPHPHHAVRVW